MSEIVPFQFGDSEVPAVVIDGEPWWFAADVCAALGIANVGNALARLDEADRDSIRATDVNRGNPNRSIVSESGLYDLVLDSRKPEAKAFRRWITSEVIPAIRRTGWYGEVRTTEQTATTAPDLLELAHVAKARIEAVNAAAQNPAADHGHMGWTIKAILRQMDPTLGPPRPEKVETTKPEPKPDALLGGVLDVVRNHPGTTVNGVCKQVPAGRARVADTLRQAVTDGLVRCTDGPNNSRLHYAVDPEPTEVEGGAP